MNYYKQGFFKPLNPQKYKGIYPIVYRSSLEKHFMEFVDDNPNVVCWGSESFKIPYIKPTDNKIHIYYVDFFIHIKNKNNEIEKYIVEVKPYKYINPPKNNKNKSKKTFLYETITWKINSAKFEAAKKFAQKYNYKFLILTEKDLKKI